MQIQRPVFAQEQRFRMSPQLFQSLKLMELPVVDLRQKIEEEIERNPALEILEDRSTVSLDEAPPRKEEDDYFEEASDLGYVSTGPRGDPDGRQQFLEAAPARPETLQEHLLWQLRLQPVSDEIRSAGELLIQNLDDDGFNKEPVAVLLKNFSPSVVQQALNLVRRLEPQGACTDNYMESLTVQATLMPKPPPGILKALEHLDLIERGRYAELARKINRSEEDVKHIAERITELSPFPGRHYATLQATKYVVPDIQVLRKGDEFSIILNDEEIPVLGISPFFLKLRKDEKAPGEKPVRDFVRENIKEARWFIQSINQRNHTLLRVSRAIVEFQKEFFLKGPKYLAPLTLKDIAGELGLHETTVSRTSSGKYMQTEWGLFELRHFFTNSISGAGSGGSSFSKGGVKEIIREIIQAEEGRLSDQDLASILAQRGIKIARRTVAKYRKEMELGSSYLR